MSFRVRLTLVAAVAVALAVVLASALVYVVARNELRGPVDDTLRASGEEISRIPLHKIQGPNGRAYLELSHDFGGPSVYVQVVGSDGSTLRPANERVPLPVGKDTLAAAGGHKGSFLSEMRVSDVHLRVLTFPYAPGYAVQIARPLTEVDSALSRMRLFLLLIAGAGIAAAAGAGLLVARAALRPVRRLTAATETVTETGDLSQRIDITGRDELSRLAGSFNTMLGALETSNKAQRQLVADASHELRTPLTSLRTNVEVLATDRALPAGERERLLEDVVEQLSEMTTLIAELIELARGEQHPSETEDVRLDLLTAEAVERARRNRPGITFTTQLDESLVHGVRSTIERAVGNLLDNAGKWSPAGGTVEVSVHEGEVVVRDHGPGITEEDLPHVFDRFYRAPDARGMPGSGLGLAIVRQVARAHGGSATAEQAEGGGARLRLRLNGSS